MICPRCEKDTADVVHVDHNQDATFKVKCSECGLETKEYNNPFTPTNIWYVKQMRAGTFDTPKIVYICNQKKCENCTWPICQHTTDIKYAANFVNEDGYWTEVVRKDEE